MLKPQKIVQEKLNSKEAAVVARLPLPAPLKRLQRIFEGLNSVHSFLQKKNIQVILLRASREILHMPFTKKAEMIRP